MNKRMDQKIRQQVFERDSHTCRYCGDTAGPFHADHVYPYSKGGETSINNLVTACQTCNRKKQNKIGRWPKPIGHFSKKPHINLLTYFGVSDLVVAFIGMASGGGVIALLIFIFGVILSVIGLYTSFTGIENNK